MSCRGGCRGLPSPARRCVRHPVFDGLGKVTLRRVRDAEVPVLRVPAFPRPVAHLLCNRQALRVVLDGIGKVPLRTIRVAEVPVRPALLRPVAHLLCNRQFLRVVLVALEKSPGDRYAIPRFEFPYAWPSPAQSPTSSAFARACVWYPMTLEKLPSE